VVSQCTVVTTLKLVKWVLVSTGAGVARVPPASEAVGVGVAELLALVEGVVVASASDVPPPRVRRTTMSTTIATASTPPTASRATRRRRSSPDDAGAGAVDMGTPIFRQGFLVTVNFLLTLLPSLPRIVIVYSVESFPQSAWNGW